MYVKQRNFSSFFVAFGLFLLIIDRALKGKTGYVRLINKLFSPGGKDTKIVYQSNTENFRCVQIFIDLVMKENQKGVGVSAGESVGGGGGGFEF